MLPAPNDTKGWKKMGTWGSGIFDNDTALDWIEKLRKTSDLSLVEEALDKVLSVGDQQLIMGHTEEGLAAAEVIARLQGNPGRKMGYTRDVARWVRKNKQIPSAKLSKKAILAIDRILTEPSEILGAWFKVEKFEEWKKKVENLRSRIRC
jgi:hypothetical protein